MGALRTRLRFVDWRKVGLSKLVWFGLWRDPSSRLVWFGMRSRLVWFGLKDRWECLGWFGEFVEVWLGLEESVIRFF